MPSTRPTKRATAAQQVERNAHLTADKARGLGWAEIAAKYALTVRQCHNIWAQRHQTAGPATDVDPISSVLEIFESLEVAVEDYVKLSEATTNDSVRLGAIRSRVETQLRRFELMREYGLAPRAQSEAQITEALQVVVTILAEVELTEDQRSRLAGALTLVENHWLRRAIPPAIAA